MKQVSDKNYLLSKYCKGRLTDNEWQVLQRWMQLKPENKVLAQQLLKLYRQHQATEAFDTISHQAAFSKALIRVRKTKRQRHFRLFGGIAASVVVLLTVASLLFLFTTYITINQPQIADQSIVPGSSIATLILGNGQELILDNLRDSVITSFSGAHIQVSDELLDYQKTDVRKNEINIIKTPRGGEYNLLLSDGTKVWLNAESELKYPVAFINEKREITLSGEAYLEVAHNQDKPFIVHTSRGAVEVLGTSFNIKDYNDEKQMATTLVEGKVRLSAKNGQQAILSPSMQGVVSAGNEINLQEVDVTFYTSWKDGLFSFRNQPLVQIMLDLSRWYNFNYWFENPDVKAIKFNGEIARYENLENLLEVLEKTHEVKFEYNNGNLLIK